MLKPEALTIYQHGRSGRHWGTSQSYHRPRSIEPADLLGGGASHRAVVCRREALFVLQPPLSCFFDVQGKGLGLRFESLKFKDIQV